MNVQCVKSIAPGPMPMARLRCPKCGGNSSWLEEIDSQLTQRCYCGLMKFLFRKTESGYTVMHRVVRPSEVKIPPEGTKLRRTLMGVVSVFPTPVCTGDVATAQNLTNKETASLMVLLATRGLVNRIEGRKGITGGSVWELSDETINLLKLRER